MKVECINCKKVFIFSKTVTITLGTERVEETHVCPYCNSLNLAVYEEPLPEVTSVLSVPLEEVDGKLKEGYMVKELYAKTATLIKLKGKEATD